METAHAVGVVVHDREVVENISKLRPGADLAAPMGDTFYRWDVLHRPSHFVQAVHGLLGDMIAGEPSIVIPVFNLVLHVSPFGPALERRPDITGVIGVVESADFANRAVMDL